MARLLDLFDVQADGQDRFIAPTGIAEADDIAILVVAADDGKAVRGQVDSLGLPG